MHAASTPAGAALAPVGEKRVAQAARALLGAIPFGFGTTTVAGTGCVVRRLTPQDDKLDVAGLSLTEVTDLAPYLGVLLGRAHRRARAFADRERPPSFLMWDESVQHALVASAIELAAAHRAAHGYYVLRRSR